MDGPPQAHDRSAVVLGLGSTLSSGFLALFLPTFSFLKYRNFWPCFEASFEAFNRGPHEDKEDAVMLL